MNKNYDGWCLKSGQWLRVNTCSYNRPEIIKEFEELMGKGSWRKYRRKGFHKIVKVKIVEVSDET